jgi:FKBP-type peptidyl-prolyl cis-trans isomerase SlyD
MDNTTLQIKDNMVVDLAYVLTVKNEQSAQSKQKQASKQFVQGRQQVVPGLEQALYGMSVGEEKDITVSASNGYGEIDPEAIKTLRRQSVPSFAQAKRGQTMRLLHKRSGEVQRAIVVEVQPETIVLDFNHPLAGKTLHYHVRVDDLRPATPEEIEAGRVKGSISQEDTSDQPASQNNSPE